MGSVVNLALPSLHGWSLEIKHTVPLNHETIPDKKIFVNYWFSGSLGFTWNTGNTWCYCKGAVPPTLTDAIQPVAISGIYNCTSAQTIELQQKGYYNNNSNQE